MVQRVSTNMVQSPGDRTQEQKNADILSALDYGASVSGTAVVNTAAINAAIVAAVASGGSGFVLIPPGITFTESSLVIPDTVVLMVFESTGRVQYLTSDTGAVLPNLEGGIVVRQQNHNGILLRGVDYGVSGDPILQVVDYQNGDVAAVEAKYLQIGENTSMTSPPADKARFYTSDDGSGNTQIMAVFPTGAAIRVCKQGQQSNLYGETGWDPGSINNGAIESKDVTVTGAVLGDYCVPAFNLDLQGLVISANVKSADTVTVTLANNTGGALNIGAGTVKCTVLRNG